MHLFKPALTKKVSFGLYFRCMKSLEIPIRLKTFVFVSILVAILVAILPTTASSDNFTKDSFTALKSRRYTPIDFNLHGYGSTLYGKKVLKLTPDEIVVTFEGVPPKRKRLYVMLELCTLDGDTIYSDATMLREDEMAAEFRKDNFKFIVPGNENIDYARCRKTGFGMSLFRRTNQYIVFESEDRAISFLNLWSYFLYAFQKEYRRAAQFFNLSLARQTEVLISTITTDDLKGLNRQMAFYDALEPLAAIQNKGLDISIVDTAVLKSYLEVVVFARKKLLSFNPQHKTRMQIEKALFKQVK